MKIKMKYLSNVMLLCVILIGVAMLPLMVQASSSSDFVIKNGVLERYNGSDVSVTIPDGVVEIGSGAFSMNSYMEGITIPNSVKKIESGAFTDCTRLKKVVIPDSVTYLGGGLFISCTSLEEVKISSNVDTLRGVLFYQCKNLKKVIVPTSVKHIVYSIAPPFEDSSSKLVVYGYSGSFIQKYCKQEGIQFKIIDKNYDKLLKKVKVTSKLTIAKSKNKTIKVTIPKGLEKVSKFTGQEGQVKVTYKTSNKKIATVNSKGNVTAKKKKGTATITATVKLQDGTYQSFKTKVKVK